MITHADVHHEVARMLHKTTLLEFMVTTQSIQHEDGTVAVEWSAVISSGREPLIYQRARSPEKLIEDLRKSVDARRAFYSVNNPVLKVLSGEAPIDTALRDPAVSAESEREWISKISPPEEANHDHPTGEFPR